MHLWYLYVLITLTDILLRSCRWIARYRNTGSYYIYTVSREYNVMLFIKNPLHGKFIYLVRDRIRRSTVLTSFAPPPLLLLLLLALPPLSAAVPTLLYWPCRTRCLIYYVPRVLAFWEFRSSSIDVKIVKNKIYFTRCNLMSRYVMNVTAASYSRNSSAGITPTAPGADTSIGFMVLSVWQIERVVKWKMR